ncbi:hypothetical protein CYMTET_12994 [Cymbomonas tetramitiformis]|uniref:Amino acid transporter transmembrane domain-containing protein n=1 Tax=Cymbomonas tetramitiformis TaxID=36881 RepID=A0AAE0GJC1_9CHLO|nr:hypothetical protein CYMTET_12994 [Cymbomonas tetramitiformis]
MRLAWYQTIGLLLASLLGSGVLSLPQAFAFLGWGPGIAVLLIFCVGSSYSGILLARLKKAIPRAVVYGDLGQSAFGHSGRRAVYMIQYFYMGSVCVVFHVGCSLALQKVFQGTSLCFPFFAVLVAAVCVPLSTFRNLHQLSGIVSVVGIITILLCLGIVLYATGSNVHESATTDIVGTFGVRAMVTGVMDILFAYGGQEIMVEMIGEMEHPNHFPRALNSVNGLLLLAYITVGGAGYRRYGRDVTSPITSQLPDDPYTRAANIALLFHLCSAYAIELNVIINATANALSSLIGPLVPAATPDLSKPLLGATPCSTPPHLASKGSLGSQFDAAKSTAAPASAIPIHADRPPESATSSLNSVAQAVCGAFPMPLGVRIGSLGAGSRSTENLESLDTDKGDPVTGSVENTAASWQSSPVSVLGNVLIRPREKEPRPSPPSASPEVGLMAGSMRRCPSSCIVEDQIHEEAVPEYSTDVFQSSYITDLPTSILTMPIVNDVWKPPPALGPTGPRSHSDDLPLDAVGLDVKAVSATRGARGILGALPHDQGPAHGHGSHTFDGHLAVWIAATLITLGYASLLSILIPFFSDLQALIGALGTTSTTFILPLLFAVVLLPEAGMMSRAEVWFCKALLLIAGLLMVLGVYSALSRVVERWSSYGSPFQCDAP